MSDYQPKPGLKVTDLEEFSLTQVWRPYWPTWLAMHGEEWDQQARLSRPPMGLTETAAELEKSSRWSNRVIDRIAGCGFWLPSYVVHPLAYTVARLVREHRLRDAGFVGGTVTP